MSTQTRLIATVVKRLERLESIKAVMRDGWSATGDRRYCVRRDDVTKAVARAMRCQVSPRLRTTVALLAGQLGWETVRNGNRRLFAGVAAHGVTDDEALEVSRAARFKLPSAARRRR